MSGTILDFFSDFGAFLQAHDFSVSESELARLLRAIPDSEIDLTDEGSFLVAATVCLAKTQEQVDMLAPLFDEYVRQKLLPRTELEQQQQRKEREVAFQVFSNDKQSKIEDLEAEKERIKQEVLSKRLDDAPKGKKKNGDAIAKLRKNKLKAEHKTTLKAFLSGANAKLSTDKLDRLAKALSAQAEDDLLHGHFESAQSAMDLIKSVEQQGKKLERRDLALQAEITEAQKEVQVQIDTLQERIRKERFRYQQTCREIDRALQDLQNAKKHPLDTFTVKQHSVLHRAEFYGGGSVQTMDSELMRIAEKPFKQLSAWEKELIRDYLRQNLLAFKTRMARNINGERRLSLNLEETLRESIRTCGQPMNLVYKIPRRSKADLILILDVSGSCKAVSELMLTFIGLLKESFPRGCSAFAFVNTLYDISKVYDTADIEQSIREVLNMIPRSGQYSNYEIPLRSMWEVYRSRITKDSMVIFIGDARNNKNDSGEEFMKNICRKAKSAYWLNTDTKDKWDEGDSIASVYGHYAKMYEVLNTKQLLGFIEKMR